MARRGWVSAETAPGDWRRLSVFDDGWVEQPGLGRTFSVTRVRLRQFILLLAAVIVALAVMLGFTLVVTAIDDPPAGLVIAPLVVLVVVLVGAPIVLTRWRLADLRRTVDDVGQARAERRRGDQVRRAPGAPLLRRADTAAELAGWLEGARHVRLGDVRDASTSLDGRIHVVTVRFTDGTVRSYRSPDRRLVELLAPNVGTPSTRPARA